MLATTVGVIEIDAGRVAGAALDRDALFFQSCFGVLIRLWLHEQRHVVHLLAGGDAALVPRGVEQGDLVVVTTPEKRLPLAFVGDGHAKEVGIESFGTRKVADPQDDVIDTGRFDLQFCLNHLYASSNSKVRISSHYSCTLQLR